MGKNVINLMILTAIVCGLGMCVASCDDDEKVKSEEQKGADSAEGITGTLEEAILRDLICQWCDVQKDELTGNWKSGSYEATVGTVLDESQPTVRSIQVDSLEKADDYAIRVFSTLGIDCMNPNGFSYSNSAVGSVSFNHSTEPNTLAVIDVDIRLIPGLQQIRLVGTMPENASGTPYYSCGDLIKYKGRFYVCTSEHKYKEKARFINFTNDIDRSTGKFNWAFVGQDTVYNDDMASFETIAGWIENILLCDQMYYEVVGRMGDNGGADFLGQVVPERDTLRLLLAAELFKLDSHCFDIHTVNSPISRYEYHYTEKKGSKDLYVFAPNGLLLANKLRWSEGFTWDQWVPYVHCVWNKEFGNFYGKMTDDESQSTLSPSHFKWQCIQVKSQKKYNIENSEFKQKDKYWICLSAIHWRHESLLMGHYAEGEMDMRTSANGLLNFTKNYVNHPKAIMRRDASKVPDSWVNRNITSLEVTFTDNGKVKSDYQSVYIKTQNPNVH